MKLKDYPYAPYLIAAATFVITLGVIKTFDISLPVSVTTRIVSGELSVVGEGKVDVVPDTASVQAGIIVSDAKTVQDAERKINDVNNKIVSELEKLGIDKKDIKTTNYSINPNYNYDGGKNNITGYYGNATLTIKVKETEKLPQVINAATQAGANQIYDTQYILDNPSKYREEAREKAIQNAREQAEKLANQLGIRLGKIVNIVESTPDSIIPYPVLRSEGIGSAETPNLSPGTQTISTVVTLYFERK